jgi:hypothetical protein
MLTFAATGGNQMACRMLYVKSSQVQRKERSAQRTRGHKRRFAMKITHKTVAQSLLLLAACVTAVAQSEIAPDHFPDQAAPVAFAPRQEAQVRPLQTRLEDYQQQLRVKSEMVENARQEAISAGIVGDGAGPFIEAYREQQVELEALEAALTPKIEQARKLIADLNRPGLTAVSSQNPVPTPLRKHKAASKQKAARPDQTRVAALNR